jgi:phosphate transport system substrate-binding protein
MPSFRVSFHASVLASMSAILGLTFSVAHAATEPSTAVGAGSTFVYPAISRWAEMYKAQTGNVINYQSIGSGAGIRQIKEKTIDFGASDKPLKKEELDQFGLAQFPVIIGGVVPVVNLEGIQAGQLKLTGTVLADIFLGKIKHWNEKPIADLNPQLKLPDSTISVVHRADGSGTTFLFTHYLSQISNEWKNAIGADSSVSWKTGIGAKGNEGVTAYVQRQKGSIGYIEFAYAKRNKLAYTLLKNTAGTFVTPDDPTFAEAATHAHWNAENAFYEILTNEAGANSWPITGATFVLVYKQANDPKKSGTVINFFDWALHKGQQEATKLDFVPLPPTVVGQIKQSWTAIHTQ